MTPVELSVGDDVAVIALNRPERLNAVNAELVDALLAAFTDVGRAGCGAVVLTGRGRAFCAGFDLSQTRGDDAGLRDRIDRLQNITRRVRDLPVPVIAAVHGHAIGAGAEFALGCDLVIAADDARFRFPEVGLGLSVTGGLTKLLPLLVGPVQAKELVLLGEPVDAQAALRLGLVNRVVPRAELMDTALDWAGKLAAQPRLATSLAKRALDAGIDTAFDSTLDLEASHAFATELEGERADGDDAVAASRARDRER